jgi:hypothetical protein
MGLGPFFSRVTYFQNLIGFWLTPIATVLLLQAFRVLPVCLYSQSTCMVELQRPGQALGECWASVGNLLEVCWASAVCWVIVGYLLGLPTTQQQGFGGNSPTNPHVLTDAVYPVSGLIPTQCFVDHW